MFLQVLVGSSLNKLLISTRETPGLRYHGKLLLLQLFVLRFQEAVFVLTARALVEEEGPPKEQHTSQCQLSANPRDRYVRERIKARTSELTVWPLHNGSERGLCCTEGRASPKCRGNAGSSSTLGLGNIQWRALREVVRLRPVATTLVLT